MRPVFQLEQGVSQGPLFDRVSAEGVHQNLVVIVLLENCHFRFFPGTL